MIGRLAKCSLALNLLALISSGWLVWMNFIASGNRSDSFDFAIHDTYYVVHNWQVGATFILPLALLGSAIVTQLILIRRLKMEGRTNA